MSTANPYSSPTGPAESRNAAAIVQGPAISLMVVSIICLLTIGLVLLFDLFLIVSGAAERMKPPALGISKVTEIGIRMGWGVVILVVNAVILAGAIKMRNLRSYGLAKCSAILAVIPCVGPCYLLGIPFGIWALVALAKPGVKDAFR
jgi:hypothetical protein